MKRVALLLCLVAASCDSMEKGGQRLEAPAELTEMLEDVIRICGDGSAEACLEAQNAPSGAVEKGAVFPSGLLWLSLIESCRSQSFAELEAVVFLTSGTTHIRAGFVRYEGGGWFSRRIVTVEESTPGLCEDIPGVHSADEAKEALADKESWILWSRRDEDGKDVADLANLWGYGCGLEAVMVGSTPDTLKRIDVGCWLPDGFPTSPESMPPVFVGNRLPYLHVQVMFTDGSSTEVSKIENPNRTTGGDVRAREVEAAKAKDDGSPPVREFEGGDPLVTELGAILDAAMVSCSDRRSSECREASSRVGAARPPLGSAPEGRLHSRPARGCRRGENYAELELEVVDGDADGGQPRIRNVLAAFIRADSGKWFLVTSRARGDRPVDCQMLPFFGVRKNMEGLDREIVWRTDGARDYLDLHDIWEAGCIVDRVEIRLEPDAPPVRPELRCWFDDGWSVGLRGSQFFLEDPLPSEVTVRVEFVDGEGTVTKTVPNPHGTSDKAGADRP